MRLAFCNWHISWGKNNAVMRVKLAGLNRGPPGQTRSSSAVFPWTSQVLLQPLYFNRQVKHMKVV